MKNVLKTIMSLAGTKNICLHNSFKNSYTAHSSYFIRDVIPYFEHFEHLLTIGPTNPPSRYDKMILICSPAHHQKS